MSGQALAVRLGLASFLDAERMVRLEEELGVMPNGDGMAQADLRRVMRAARMAQASSDELRAAILAARASGETYRDIAKAAGLSHQRVWQIANEDRR